MRAQPLSKMALARWSALRCSARMVLLVRSRAGKTKPSHGDVVGISDSGRYSPQRRGADASVLHPRTRPRSHGRNGENAKCDSQPRARQKTECQRTRDRKTVQEVLQGHGPMHKSPGATCYMRTESGLEGHL